MTTVIKRSQTIPPEFAVILHELHETNSNRQLNAILAHAVKLGWTLRALSAVLGISHQAVHHRVRRHAYASSSVTLNDLIIPLPPCKPPYIPPVRKIVTHVGVSPEIIIMLIEMQKACATVNGGTSVDDPRRWISENLAALMNHLIERGVTVSHMARVMDVSPNTVKFRLGRFGYRSLPPSCHRWVYKGVKVGASITNRTNGRAHG